MGDTNGQIEKCIIFIKDHVTDVDSVADKLIEKGVLKMSERESIVGNKSPREQIQGILDIVTKRKKEDVFIAVLNETQNEHVAKKITSMEITTGQKDFDRSKTFTKSHAETEEPAARSLKHLKNIQKKLRVELNDKTLRLKELTLASHEDKKKCAQLQNENQKLKAENQELAEKKQKITQLQTEIEHLKTELDGKTMEIDILDKRLSCVEDELRLHKEIHKEVTQLRTDNIQLRSENADIKSICAKTSEDVSQLVAKINSRQNPRSIPPWRTGTKMKLSTPRKK